MFIRVVSFHLVHRAIARVVFLSREKIDERFQSIATFLNIVKDLQS